MSRMLQARPLTVEAFAPYGEVIETPPAAAAEPMNDGDFARFDGLAEIAAPQARIGLARSLRATTLPHTFVTIERHPHSSQAFVPLGLFRFVVVVAPAGEHVGRDALAAFVSDGRQGINYRLGTWHLPLIALAVGQQFLVIDSGSRQATEQLRLAGPVTLAETG